MSSVLLAPSLLAADFANLQTAVALIDQASPADWLHFDVMDGVFVPNISIGAPVLKAIRPYTTKPIDVHLMIVEPSRHIDAFVSAGADIITVHLEACTHLHKVLEQIRQAGCKVGVALNPHTPVESIIEIADMIDILLIMSVNPGFGGQKFIPHSLIKIRKAADLLARLNPNALIQVDGGIDRTTIAAARQAGAHVMVAGNAIFSAKDSVAEMEVLSGLMLGV